MHSDEWDLDALDAELGSTINVSVHSIADDIGKYTIDDLKKYVKEEAQRIYQAKEERIGRDQMSFLERYFILKVIDEEWKDHLFEMDMLKEGIHLRAYGQKDPLIEYKREAYFMFEKLIHTINEKTLNWLWKFQIQVEPTNRTEARAGMGRMQLIHESADNMGFSAAQQTGGETDIQRASKERSRKKQPIRVEKKIGPNEPCPCGSGKKYKKCHGRVV